MFDYIWDKDEEIDIEELELFNDAILKEVESTLGVKLPSTYVELMKEKNGGTLAYNELHSKKVPEGELLIQSLKGIALDDGIGENNYLLEEWELPEGLILLGGDGHTWVALDYRNYDGDNPPVYCIESGKRKGKQISDAFEGFLKQLKEPEPLEDDDDENDDDDLDFSRIYTKEELGKYIEEGSSLFHISGGLEQFAREKGDMNWYIDQCLKALNKKELDHISWTVGECVLIKLKVEPKENWPINSLKEIVNHLMTVPLYDDVPDFTAQRLGKRLQRKIS
ncbi:SMI1/KNR4 family protein [Rummeliibacillus sp. G93]|uniref:SMI1/KNR4 family protein n=1 Tax=Rummeliibacillus sp. G93 TaxID=2939494 RepID=UPI00201BB0D6|nr:SMI1/KNR4 family protein [Rummeliibacillus sp. G93]UQW96238.1 SMI1/KNR4 family protein [Rummeliibacillus sp. G93]